MRIRPQLCLLALTTLPCQLSADAVLAVEYPPFTTEKAVNGGIVVSMLHRVYPERTFIPQFVPPKRAVAILTSGDWCLSLYPPPEDVMAESISLSENLVHIGLLRLRQANIFTWSDLAQLEGLTVALLRTDENGKFARQFSDAGLQLMYVETIEQGLHLVEKQRADLVMFDNFNYSLLADNIKSRFQFSQTILISTPLTLFVNPECHLQLAKPTDKIRF